MLSKCVDPKTCRKAWEKVKHGYEVRGLPVPAGVPCLLCRGMLGQWCGNVVDYVVDKNDTFWRELHRLLPDETIVIREPLRKLTR